MPVRILGIDPGSNVTGYSMLLEDKGLVTLADFGAIQSVAKSEHFDKVKFIFSRVCALLDELKPDILAIEDPFYGKNVQSMLKLGRIQGVIIAAAIQRDITVFEYAPRRVKQSVTGRGSASKEQVAAMVKTILGNSFENQKLDVTDSAAIALAYVLSDPLAGERKNQKPGKKSSWEKFLAANPERKA